MDDKKIGFFSLFTMGIGYIIGSGIFAMLPVVMGMTGRSISLACLTGAVLCLFSQCIPGIFLSSVIDLPGGSYSQGLVIFPKVIAGVYGFVYIVGMLTFAGSIVSLTGYTTQLIPGLTPIQKILSYIYLIVFFLIGIMGVSLSAKFQNVAVIILLISLATFIVGGLPHIDFRTYFGDGFFSGGGAGFMSAAAMMSFSALGGQAILSFGSVAKNPKKNIPLAMLTSTLFVGVIYLLIGIVASGIVPIDEVTASANLGSVAVTFMPSYIYMFLLWGWPLYSEEFCQLHLI